MRFRITSFYAAVLLGLSACETAIPSQSPNSVITTKSADSLPPQELAIGDCGLFVWSAQSRQFMLFAQGTERATWAKNGVQSSLFPMGDDPISDLNRQVPAQKFVDASGQQFDLSFTKAAALGQAIRYSQGSWRYKDKDGWDSFTPVYGLSTCITDPDRDTSENLSISYDDLQRPLKLKPVAIQQSAQVIPTPIPILPAPLAPIPPAPLAPIPPPPEIEELLPNLPIAEPVQKLPVIKANFIAPEQPPPEPEPAGPNYYVQIASLKSQTAAEEAWVELSEESELLRDQSHFIWPVDLAEKGLYFRLQIGAFARHVSAVNFCKNLKAEGQDCFVIKR